MAIKASFLWLIFGTLLFFSFLRLRLIKSVLFNVVRVCGVSFNNFGRSEFMIEDFS